MRFKLEQRLEDNATNRVRYSYTEEVVLSLNVPEKSACKQSAVGFFKWISYNF